MVGKTFRDQIVMFYNADIIFSPHGTAIDNVIFSRPHSVLIECYPPYFYEMCFLNMALLSRLHYIGVTTYFPHDKHNSHWQRAEEAYYNGNFFKIRRDFVISNIDPPLFHVMSAVQDAVQYVERWRFVYEISDKWSPLFF